MLGQVSLAHFGDAAVRVAVVRRTESASSSSSSMKLLSLSIPPGEQRCQVMSGVLLDSTELVIDDVFLVERAGRMSRLVQHHLAQLAHVHEASATAVHPAPVAQIDKAGHCGV